MYPEHDQLDPDNPDCRESSAYPANPDSEYGWENYSPNVYIFLITVIMICLYGLLDTITSLGLKALTKEVERKHQQQSVEKS